MKINFPFRFCIFGILLLSVEIPLLADDCCLPDCCEYSCRSGRFNVGAEWLYWKVKEDNLRAGVLVDDFPDPVLKRANASVIQPKFKFNNGFRGNIGYEHFCDQWGLNAIYTYVPLRSNSDFREVIPVALQTQTHRQFIVPNINEFPSFQAFGSSQGVTAFTSLFTKWNGNLSYVDIDLSRKLTFNSFNLRPHIGFRAAWMNQHLLMKGGLPQPSTNNSTFGSLKYTEKLNGYGVEGGFWADWRFGCRFSIVGHVGGSILYSCFRTDILSESSLGEDGAVVFIIKSGLKDTTAIPSMDYFAGLKYERSLRRFLVSVHAGWEQRIFFNMNEMAISSGNLSLQGLTVGADVSF